MSIYHDTGPNARYTNIQNPPLEFGRLKKYLSTQRFYHPNSPLNSFEAAARLYFKCRKKGITIRSTIDCLIAQIAIENNLALLHNDRDFEAMSAVAPLKFCTLEQQEG